ncbi:hypothetical protein BaRGS_00000757 [Batillaria attramentaria]|uniref:LSM domain-containing protein n=1 Tax=Batillaria attramentaria TaxID=370345 RepID=A0ABD0M8U2_9CAEN
MAEEKMEAGASNSTNTGGLDQSANIDFASHDFDPLSVLYSPDFLASDTNLATYDSVQHFLTTHLSKVRAEKSSACAEPSSQKLEGTDTLRTEPDSVPTTERTSTEAETTKTSTDLGGDTTTPPHSRGGGADVAAAMELSDIEGACTPTVSGGGVVPSADRRKKPRVNVITQMQTSYNRGPLNLLKRSVAEKLKVRVWTRSVRNVRGIMTGYVVAFDKHLNLAMIDVDELYRKPPGKHQKAGKKASKEADVPEKHEDNTEEPLVYPQTQWQPAERTAETGSPSVPSVNSSSSLRQLSDHCGHDPGWLFTGAGKDVIGEVTSAFSGMHVFDETDMSQLLGVKTRRLLSRHLNQVLLRGDHVVAVALAEPPCG